MSGRPRQLRLVTEGAVGSDQTDPVVTTSPEAPDGDLGGLLERSARGHEDAFAELYDRTSSRVHGLILRVVRSADHAAEVTQEVYVEIWRMAARYRSGQGSALAFILTIAHRRAVDRVRSAQRELDRDQRYSRQNHTPDIDQVWDGVSRSFDVERVRRALQSLTAIQREAVTLSYYGGYSQSQVAELLGLPLGTTKSRIRDGLIGLRDALGVER